MLIPRVGTQLVPGGLDTNATDGITGESKQPATEVTGCSWFPPIAKPKLSAEQPGLQPASETDTGRHALTLIVSAPSGGSLPLWVQRPRPIRRMVQVVAVQDRLDPPAAS